MEQRGDTGEPDGSKVSSDSSEAVNGVGQGQPGEEKDVLIPVSPRLLLGLGAVAAILSVAAAVSQQVSSHGLDTGWARVDDILNYLSNAFYFAGVLVGLGALVMALSKGVSRFVRRTARLLLLGGVAVVVFGIADAVCIGVGQLPSGEAGSWYIAGYIFSRLAVTVYYAGVLGGLACVCLRLPRRPMPLP